MIDAARRLLPVTRDAILVVIVTFAVWLGSGWLLPSSLERTLERPQGIVHSHTGTRLWLTGIATSIALTALGLRRRRHWFHVIAVGLLLCAGVTVWMLLTPMRSGGHGPHVDLRVLLVGYFAVTTLVGLAFGALVRWVRHGGG